jgi:hypothetical protein
MYEHKVVTYKLTELGKEGPFFGGLNDSTDLTYAARP